MRVLPALALASALFLGGCQNPDGSVNLPATLALGAGAAVAGVAIASANDGPRHSYGHRGGYYGRPSYGYARPHYGYARPHYGYARPHYGYRRW
jgi:hypothetical protein